MRIGEVADVGGAWFVDREPATIAITFQSGPRRTHGPVERHSTPGAVHPNTFRRERGRASWSLRFNGCEAHKTAARELVEHLRSMGLRDD